MFKVVICDDERIIREGLKQIIPWETIISIQYTLLKMVLKHYH